MKRTNEARSRALRRAGRWEIVVKGDTAGTACREFPSRYDKSSPARRILFEFGDLTPMLHPDAAWAGIGVLDLPW